MLLVSHKLCGSNISIAGLDNVSFSQMPFEMGLFSLFVRAIGLVNLCLFVHTTGSNIFCLFINVPTGPVNVCSLA